MSDICDLSLTELRSSLLRREFSVRDAVRSLLGRIEDTEPRINSLVRVEADTALGKAGEMDADGPDPDRPLWGVPVVVKDVLATRDVATTCASRILEGFVPFYDAEPVRRLKEAGAIVLAKSNMDEFAMGSSTENSAFGVTRNPWDLSRVPGGSSGGSAASTAARQAPGSLGSDTGGSIRQPAAFCGLVGLKPTYGRISRFGLIAYGSSLDQVGPLTRTVRDGAAMLQVMAGRDEKDSTSSPAPVPDYLSALERRGDLQGLKLGVPQEYWGEGLAPEVSSGCRRMLDAARDAGAEIVPVSLPHSPYAIAAYYILVMAEASSNLARYDGVRYGLRASEVSEIKEMYFKSRSTGFGNEVQRRIILGTFVLSSGYYEAYYRKAAQVRRLIRDDYLKALQSCDLICAPASPDTAFEIGEKTHDPLQMYLTDIFTNPLNLTGLPGLCLPAGLGEDTGLPVGFQLFGPAFGEELLLQTGSVLERAVGPLPPPRGLESS
jgi:aspartyl-tRNA(Asn)/glutamyl-tRNA(Gln) amidotransferase subunit A